MLLGRHSEDTDRQFKLNFPVARNPILIEYDEAAPCDPTMRKKFLQKTVQNRRHLFLKRLQNPPIVELRIDQDPVYMSNTLHKILARHPFPFYQGPLIIELEKSIRSLWTEIPDSVALNAKTQFSHDESQACWKWTPMKTGLEGWGLVDNKVTEIESYEVSEEQTSSIFGPACSLQEMRWIYTCQLQKCKIGCPCSICGNSGINCKDDCQNRCKKCSPQCREHKIAIPRTFDAELDHFTMITSGKNFYHYALPYAGIPLSCKACSEDLHQHQILHLVFHFNCKFCRQDSMPYKDENVISLKDYKAREIEIFKNEDSTCSVCYKKFADRTLRRRHQKRSHGTFSCSDCNAIMTSQWKLQQNCHSQHGKNDGKAQLKKHKKAKSNTDYDCGYCSSKFSYDYALSRHL